MFTPFNDQPLTPPTQPSVVIAGYEVRVSEDGESICYADMADVLGVSIGWLRTATGKPSPTGACLPTKGRPPALYPLSTLLNAIRASEWQNKRHALAALER